MSGPDKKTPLELERDGTSPLPLSPIQKLIKYIQAMIDQKFEPLKVIESPEGLITALNDLDGMIEMHEIKKTIVNKIQMMIILAYRDHIMGTNKGKFDDHMLHGVFYGPPGVGKSTAAVKIAKIFMAIGVISAMKKRIEERSIVPQTTISQLPIAQPSGTIPPSPPINCSDEHHQLSSDLRNAIACEMGNFMKDINTMRDLSVAIHSSLSRDTIPEEVKSVTSKYLKDLVTSSQHLAMRTSSVIGLCQTDDDLEDEEEEEFPLTTIHTSTTIPVASVTPLIAPISVPPLTLTPAIPRITLPTEKERKGISDDIPVVIAGRTDLVAEFSGQTGPKTQAFFAKHRGKVIIIEEAYTLYTGDRDTFGFEALTEVTRIMDEKPDEYILYLNGYKEVMESTIFAVQPGLKRRCQEVYNIQGYTHEGLMLIFKKQMERNGWTLDPKIPLAKIFKDRAEEFKAFGGDTLRLVSYCKEMYADASFHGICESLSRGELDPSKHLKLEITHDIILKGMEKLAKNQVDEDPANRSPPPPPPGMYL